MSKRHLDSVAEQLAELGREFNPKDAYTVEEIEHHEFCVNRHTLPIIGNQNRDQALQNHYNCQRCFSFALKCTPPFLTAYESLALPCSYFGPKSTLIPHSIGCVATKNGPLLNDSHYIDLVVKGYTVIDGVFLREDVNKVKESFFTWLEDLGTGIDRNNIINTYNPNTAPGYVSNGIITYPPPYFTPPAIFVRTYPNVRKVFASVWGTEDSNLLVSYDRINLTVPAKKSADEECRWFHLDQGIAYRNVFDCYQGVVNLSDVSENGGSFSCIPGSHHFHGEILDVMTETFGADTKKNFVKPDQHNQGDFLAILKAKWNLEPKVVRPLKAGSMILWDSRVVHANVPPKVGSNEIRMAAYVTMVPRSKATPVELGKRRKYFIQARGTSHSPHHTNVFPKGPPYNYGKPGPKYNTLWTDQGKIRDKALEYFEECAKERGDLTTVIRHYGFDNASQYNDVKKTPIDSSNKDS